MLRKFVSDSKKTDDRSIDLQVSSINEIIPLELEKRQFLFIKFFNKIFLVIWMKTQMKLSLCADLKICLFMPLENVNL